MSRSGSSGPGGRSASIARNAGFAFASKVATAAFTAVITVFLVRELDPAGYGIFALALGFAGLMVLPADFGISPAAARFIAERRGDDSAVADVFASATKLKLVLTLAMAVLLAVLAEPIASLYSAPDLAWPLRAVAIALFGQSFVFLFSNAFIALGRNSRDFILTCSEAITEASATIVLVLIAGGATAAAFGRAIGYSVGAIVGVLLLLRLLAPGSWSERRGGPPIRRLAGYAGALLVVDSAYAIFSQIDLLLVGALVSTTAAGIYGAPLKLTALLHYPGLAIANAVSPRISRHDVHEPDTAALVTGLRLLVILQAAIATALVVWARPIVDLVLGPGYGESADVLRALGPFVFLSGLGPLVSTSVNYLGEARRRVPIAIGSLVVNVIGILILVPWIGIVGAAISVDVAYAIYVGAHLRICAELLGFSPRPLARTTLHALVAAAALAGALLAFGASDLNALEWIGGALAGTVAFVGALMLTGETSREELASLAATLRSAARTAEPAAPGSD